MLRRPPTVLTLTSEDLKAYEDRRDALRAQAHQQQIRRHHLQTPLAEQISRSTSASSYEDVTDSTHHAPAEEDEEEDDEDVEEEEDDEEDSYYPRRYRTIEDPDEDVGPQIFLNEADAPDLPSDPFTSSSGSGGSLVSAAANDHHQQHNSNAEEDHVMAELAPEDLPEARLQGDSSRSGSANPHPQPVSRFGRRTAAAAVTPTAGGRANGAAGVSTPEAPVRQTRSREERILGRGARR